MSNPNLTVTSLKSPPPCYPCRARCARNFRRCSTISLPTTWLPTSRRGWVGRCSTVTVPHCSSRWTSTTPACNTTRRTRRAGHIYSPNPRISPLPAWPPGGGLLGAALHRCQTRISLQRPLNPASYLFSGTTGRAAVRKVDKTIHRLPGFAGASLLEAWIDREVGCWPK